MTSRTISAVTGLAALFWLAALPSIPSSNIESCAGVKDTVPLVACGQISLPRSSLL